MYRKMLRRSTALNMPQLLRTLSLTVARIMMCKVILLIMEVVELLLLKAPVSSHGLAVVSIEGTHTHREREREMSESENVLRQTSPSTSRRSNDHQRGNGERECSGGSGTASEYIFAD